MIVALAWDVTESFLLIKDMKKSPRRATNDAMEDAPRKRRIKMHLVAFLSLIGGSDCLSFHRSVAVQSLFFFIYRSVAVQHL